VRILLVANTLPPSDLSGVGEQVMQLASGLRARGHEVAILGRGGSGARGPKLLFPFAIVRPALREIVRFRPDVVQVHESDGGLLAATLRLRRRRPLLTALLQVSYVEERRAVRPLVWSGEVLGEPGVVERRFRRWKAVPQIVLGRLSARAADLVFAPSRATAAELAADYGVTSSCVLPNVSGGVALASREVRQLAGERGGWLFVGRLRIRKGVEVLMRALSLLDDPTHTPLWIAGDGEHRAALEQTARRFGLEHRARFLGLCDGGQVRWLLARASALVVPSIYEGMPLVILEAMAEGLPVIASRVSGIPEVVEDGTTGWLVPAEDPPALARALAEALRPDGERQRRGAEGRSRLEQRFRPAAAAEIWERAVAAALGERTPR